MPLARLSVSARFLLVLTIGFVFQAGISVVSLLDLRRSLIQDRTVEIKHLLETAYSTVVFYNSQAHRGLMTDEAARQAAINAVRAMHYDGTNYFFIWDLNGTSIAHGGNPALEGKNFIDSPEATKRPVVSYMVQRLIDVARSDAKEGVTTYRIPKPGQTVPLEKIAYSRLFAPWGWSVGTGAYIDDIDQTFQARAFESVLIFLALMVLSGIITYLIGNDLARAMNRLSARVAGVAKGELDGEVPEVERRDEVGVMARALLLLRDTSREVSELKLDQLTGLPARKLLLDRLKQAKARSARSGKFCGLMLIDLDKFKSLNDTHGHDAGDLLLQEVARRLSACVRESDTVARLGGDEFVVVLADVKQDEDGAAAIVESVGEKILATLNKTYHLGNIAHQCTASIGITLFKGGALSANELLKQADLAMYTSKEAGRNNCRFFDANMEATVHARTNLERELRKAVLEKQFQLYYQAQVAADGHLVGVEALVRWRHPQRGLLLPSAFIPLAEETGTIIPLGQWVLETACRQLAAWAERPETAKLKMAINVSAAQFRRPEFVEQVLATLACTGADPNRITLEFTESLLLNNVLEIVEKMSILSKRGIGFALDDFGIGFSSLSHLKLLPLCQLTIDRRFVHDMLADPNIAATVKAIIALAQSLGFSLIAEGIETAAQRDFLSLAGCRDYQGFLFSPPLTIEDFEEFANEIAVAQSEPMPAYQGM